MKRKKLVIPNNYSDWNLDHRINMHILMLRMREWFYWTNLFWITLTAYLVSGSIYLTIFVSCFSVMLLVMLASKITDHDYE